MKIEFWYQKIRNIQQFLSRKVLCKKLAEIGRISEDGDIQYGKHPCTGRRAEVECKPRRCCFFPRWVNRARAVCNGGWRRGRGTAPVSQGNPPGAGWKRPDDRSPDDQLVRAGPRVGGPRQRKTCRRRIANILEKETKKPSAQPPSYTNLVGRRKGEREQEEDRHWDGDVRAPPLGEVTRGFWSAG